MKAENIIYTSVVETAFGKTSTNKTIKARVYRNPIANAKTQDGKNDYRYAIEILIPKDADVGISTVHRMVDSVQLPVNLGEANSTLRVSTIIKQDDETFHLGLIA